MKINQLKGGALLSYVSIFLTNIIGLILTPFIIRSLGSAEYGLYTMIGAYIGYMSVLDFGLNNTVIRFIAKYNAEKDKKGEENFLAHSFIMYICISICICICIGICICICKCICIGICVGICICIRICVGICIRMCISIGICICICTCTCIYAAQWPGREWKREHPP